MSGQSGESCEEARVGGKLQDAGGPRQVFWKITARYAASAQNVSPPFPETFEIRRCYLRVFAAYLTVFQVHEGDVRALDEIAPVPEEDF